MALFTRRGRTKAKSLEKEYLRVRIYPKVKFLSNYNLLVTSFYTNDLSPVLGFFESNTKMKVPKDAKNKLKDRLDAVKAEFGSQNDIEKIVDDLKKKIDDLFKQEILTSNDGLKNSANNSKLSLLPEAPVVNCVSECKLNDEEVIYTFTDETTHIFTQGKDVIVVDAGCQLLINGVAQFVPTPDYENVHIYITHFHLDHVQALAGLIQKEFNDNKKVTLHLHEVLRAEFIGWASQNWEIISPSEQKKKFILDILNDSAPKDKPYPLKNSKSESKHFIASSSWIFTAQASSNQKNNIVSNKKDNSKGCNKIFTGDFNAQFIPDADPKKLREDGIKGYFDHIQPIIDQSSCAYVFWDWGHLIAGSTPETYKPILDQPKYQKLKYIWEHEKNNNGFLLKKINLKTTFSYSNHFIVENANSLIFSNSKQNNSRSEQSTSTLPSPNTLKQNNNKKNGQIKKKKKKLK